MSPVLAPAAQACHGISARTKETAIGAGIEGAKSEPVEQCGDKKTCFGCAANVQCERIHDRLPAKIELDQD